MVVSIGLIVKNEEKYLEQCLTALQPILNELDSELIISDTGSTDNTVEIAKKFTDNVVHFEWINDFAAARNSTLERAQGEWYMFIDADEIAEDCSEIINFFKSGEYKKFGSATYIVRSGTNTDDPSQHVDFRPMRLTRRMADTHFIKPIHEVLEPLILPTKHLDFVVLHYGYQFADEEGKNRAEVKSKRNLEILLNEINDETKEHNPIIYDQIADAYGLVEDYENALKYVSIGLEKSDHRSSSILPFYSHKIDVLFKLNKVDELIKVSDEFFDININPFHTRDFPSDCFIRAMRGRAFVLLNENRKAIREWAEFIKLYGKYCKGKFNEADFVLDMWRATDSIVKASYNDFMGLCIHEGQFEFANEYAKMLALEKFFDDHDFIENHISKRIDVMDNIGFNDFDRFHKQLDDFGKTCLMNSLRQRVFKTSIENREVIIKKLASFKEMTAEVADIYNGYFDGAPDFERISSFLDVYGAENAEDMLYIMLENQMDISPFLLSDGFFADKAVQIVMHLFPHGLEMYEHYNINNISQGFERAARLYGFVMLRAAEMEREITGLFETYAALGQKWFDVYGESMGMPGDVRAALLAGNVVLAKEAGDYTRFMDAIRELKSVVTDIVPVAEAYKKENKGSLKRSNGNPELKQLAAQVKRTIRDMIAVGNINEARKLIKELEGIIPNDPDIEDLKDEINTSLQ